MNEFQLWRIFGNFASIWKMVSFLWVNTIYAQFISTYSVLHKTLIESIFFTYSFVQLLQNVTYTPGFAFGFASKTTNDVSAHLTFHWNTFAFWILLYSFFQPSAIWYFATFRRLLHPYWRSAKCSSWRSEVRTSWFHFPLADDSNNSSNFRRNFCVRLHFARTL